MQNGSSFFVWAEGGLKDKNENGRGESHKKGNSTCKHR